MPLFDHTGDKLAAGPALLLPADPGAALLDAARLYDPHLRRWHGRLVFSPELQLRLAEAALALARRAGGIAIDMFGFRFDTAQELVSVSERTPAP
jgi:hypothetical protein